MTSSRRDTHRAARAAPPGPAAAPSTPLDPSGDPLLAAKLTVPRHPAALVVRQRLLHRLTEGAGGPLTVITGAAGVGKTALAASWTAADEAPGPVLWVTPDADDSPGAFWAYVLEAFRRGGVPLDGDVGAPACADSVDHALLVRLAAALERLPVPVVLVLDGLDEVPGREVPAGLRFVLEHAGPRLRLVLLGRTDPPLPLHRYRAEQRLYEIRGADLAFTLSETAALLRGHGLAPRDDVVAALVSRTEGWAAGLRLCALAMERCADPAGFVRSFHASEHAVADYLLAEVLDAQPAATRQLLLRASILDQVHPGLADALTAHTDAERVLAHLARAHAFVEPIDDTGWYRLHPLFAAVLRAHLRSRRPGLEAQLHHRAARWLAGSGRITAALHHAAAGGDWQFAAAQAVRHLLVGPLLTGGPHSPARTLAAMPDAVDGAEPALITAACLLSRQDLAGCRAHLVRAEDHLRRKGPRATPEEQLALALLRLLSEPFDGPDAAEAVDGAARRVAELMAQVPSEALTRHPEIEALRRHGTACALLRTGLLDAARAAFEEAVRACSGAATTHVVRHRALGRLALSEAVQGALTAAEEHGRASYDDADRHGVPEFHRSGAGHLALAAVAVERGDAQLAVRHLALAGTLPDTDADPVLVTERSVLRAHVDVALGRWRDAVEALTRPLPQPPGSAWLTERRAVAQATAALAHGDPATALTVLDGADHEGAAWTLALAEAHLATGRPAPARVLLAGLDGASGLPLSDLVRLRLLRARVAVLDKDLATARALLAQAVDSARPQRLVCPFQEAGPWVRQLLADQHGLRGRAAWLTAGPSPAGAEPVVIEELSPRQREVLALVARMLSTDEIAAELHLSVNTVKTHLRGIYRKLSVSRRREAVERGRELHLI